MLDLIFPKVMTVNPVNFICFYNDRWGCLRDMYISLADRSGKDNPTIAVTLSALVS
jgi:hypothetical protein